MKRSFKSFFTSEQVTAYQRGTMHYRYRDRLCNKSPIDLAIYLRLLQDAKPRTLFEIGSKAGGSALLLRDFGRALELHMEVISIDTAEPDVKFEGVTFLEGDVHHLGRTFAQHQLDRCLRPWLAIEDSAHTAEACTAALGFFAERLHPGEWLAMEDGILDELGLKEKFGGGPNQAIAQFLDAHPGVFEIGIEYCDMFGPNATYNPNGYLKRTVVPLNGS